MTEVTPGDDEVQMTSNGLRDLMIQKDQEAKVESWQRAANEEPGCCRTAVTTELVRTMEGQGGMGTRSPKPEQGCKGVLMVELRS